MNSRRLFCCLVVGCLTGLSACGGGLFSSSGSPTPTPSIASISPSNATAGSPGFTLTVNGSGFVKGSTLVWSNFGFAGGTPTVTVVSATQLTAQISAADIAVPGTAQVTVDNPGGFFGPSVPPSNTVSFVINTGPAGVLQTISLGANGATPNGNSHDPVLSAHDEFVAFSSEATDLIVPNANFPQGYLRDTCLGAKFCTPATQMVSVITGDATEGNGLGGATPSIGNVGLPGVIGFLSTATNLVTPHTKSPQAFVRDPNGKTTVLASVTENGTEPNGPAIELTIDNCEAAFVSSATDVVSGVTTPNQIYMSTSCANPAAGFTSTKLVSADSAGHAANQGAQQPAISTGGRFIVFASTSTNLPGAPGAGAQQIFLRDTCNGSSSCTPTTTLVSVDNSGSPLAGSSQTPAISDDGRFIVFTTQTPVPTGGVTINVAVRDTCVSSNGPVLSCTPSTTSISMAADGSAGNGPSSSNRHAISGDGRYVVFSSSATNLITGGNPAAQVFVRDTCKSSSGTVSACTPRTVLISVDSTGTPTGGFAGAISEDGHFAAFETTIAGVSQILLAATGF